MAKKSKQEAVKLDPVRGDQILKRMLKTKPKTHEEMVKGGKGKPKQASK